jgi:GntR family transcriptional regulator
MEFKDKQSIYLQIADYVCEQLLLGKWPASERIPSVRDLAVTLEVNPNTVMRTYDFLQGKNIIFNKRGIGFFAEEEATARIRQYRKERFLESELPEFFRTLYLLDISMDELQQRYHAFISEAYPTTT